MNPKKKQTLSDSDIVTNTDNKKTIIRRNGVNVSTLALALALTTGSGTMLSSCSDGTDCDSDTTRYADPAADSGAGSDPYDSTDSDQSSYADSKPCD